MRMTLVAALAVLTAAAGLSVQASEAPQVESYVLENGLQVILVPDHRVPKVAVTLTYKVGSVNEPAGRSGFAHLFEHLMFSGTAAFPHPNEFFADNGLTYNGSTERDFTRYYEEGLSSTLPLILSFEADRMANLGANIEGAELDTERNVVRNEMREKVVEQAGAGAVETLNTALFPLGHPYAHSPSGSFPDLAAAGLGDVKAFFDLYYAPNNAILVISGDFDAATTRAQIESTFALLQRGSDVPAVQTPTFEPTKAHLIVEDKVPLPLVLIGFNGPTVGKDDYALYVAAELLGNAEYGYLTRTLVNGGKAQYASASWARAKLGGEFQLGIYAMADDPDPEATLRQAVTDFLAQPIDPADVERAKKLMIQGDRVRREPFLSRAMALGRDASDGLDINTTLVDDPQLIALTAADVEAAMREVLRLDAASVIIVNPAQTTTEVAVFNRSTGEPAPLETKAREPVAIPLLAVGEPRSIDLPSPETAVLSNGIKVVHYRLAGTPTFYIVASASGGARNEPEAHSGLSSMALDMATRGAGDKAQAEYAKALNDVGAFVSGIGGDVRSEIMLGVPLENVAVGIPLLADAVRRPRFDEDTWAIALRQAITGLQQRANDLGASVQTTATERLYIPNQGQSAANTTVDSISTITTADLKAFFGSLFVPRTMVFYSVGDIALADLVPVLEKSFGDWSSESPGMAVAPDYKLEFPDTETVLFIPDPGASQSVVTMFAPAPGFGNPGLPSALVFADVFGGGPVSRLNAVMRIAKGYTYGASAGVAADRMDESLLFAAATVETAATGEAIHDLKATLAGLVTTPITDKELQRSLTGVLVALASGAETGEQLAGQIFGAIGEGQTVEELNAEWRKITDLKLGDVQAIAGQLSSTDRALIVIGGDPGAVLPQLAAIGIKNVETVPRTGQ